MSVNKNLPQAVIAEYVAGAKDMETRVYVMSKTKKNLEERKNAIEAHIKERNQKTKNNYDKCKTHYCAHKFTPVRDFFATFFSDGIEVLIGGIVIFGILSGILTGILYAILDNMTEFVPDEHFFLSVFIAIAVTLFLITLICTYCDEKKKFRKHHLELDKQFKNAEEEFRKAQEFESHDNITISIINKEIRELGTSIQIVKEKLAIYYQANIIPPDYRNDICVVVIDYVFRNDQADTMREATLLCDQHIRHIDLIDALKDIAKILRHIATTLDDINGTINEMSNEIKNISAGQRSIAHDTCLSRYAAESIQASAERLEWQSYLKN